MSGDWSAWIGRTERRAEIIDAWRVAALAATLDLEQGLQAGAPLPPCWHWLFFNPVARRGELGSDGHPRRGGFLPPVDLPRRMWAGSRMAFHAPVVIGAEAVRTSAIARIEEKAGRSGPLVFVTVSHSIESGGALCIVEEQDLVYRPVTAAGAKPAGGAAAPDPPRWRREVLPDTVTLFRYSALTFNGHRIHYDLDYAVREEGYPNLVVHGPLTATLLAGFAASLYPERRMTGFRFRGVAPLFAGQPVVLEANPGATPAELELGARKPDGAPAMQSGATFA